MVQNWLVTAQQDLIVDEKISAFDSHYVMMLHIKAASRCHKKTILFLFFLLATVSEPFYGQGMAMALMVGYYRLLDQRYPVRYLVMLFLEARYVLRSAKRLRFFLPPKPSA